MAYTFNPLSGKLDYYKDNFGTNGIYLVDNLGQTWQVTVDSSGALVTTLVVAPTGNYLLQEDGFKILLEDNSGILLEV